MWCVYNDKAYEKISFPKRAPWSILRVDKEHSFEKIPLWRWLLNLSRVQTDFLLSWVGSLLLCWNTITKSTFGREGLFGLHFLTVLHHWRKSGQKLKQGRILRAWADGEALASYWLPPHGLLSLLPFRTQDHLPRLGPTHSGLEPFTSTTKKMPYMPARSPVFWRPFLN